MVEDPPGSGPGRGTWLSWFLTFWPLQIGGWGLMFLVPLMLMVSGSITDPSTLCYGITRPMNGFLRTLIAIFFIRGATFMIWQLLYIGIKSIYGGQAKLTLDHTETVVRAQVSLPCFGTA